MGQIFAELLSGPAAAASGGLAVGAMGLLGRQLTGSRSGRRSFLL